MTKAGLVLQGSYSLSQVCAPLADPLSRCFWVVDVQSGPFNSLWVSECPESEALIDELSWEVPAFEYTSTHGFRPGASPRLTGYLQADEWSYYFAIDSPEPEALRRATVLAEHVGDLTEAFLWRLGEVADLFVCHADGWWEFYTGRPEWHARLRSHWSDCRARPLAFAGQSP